MPDPIEAQIRTNAQLARLREGMATSIRDRARWSQRAQQYERELEWYLSLQNAKSPDSGAQTQNTQGETK
jgi:hypothetical protein